MFGDEVAGASGPALAALLSRPPAGMADDELVDLVVGWERLASWVAAGQLAAIAELARRRPRSGTADAGHPGLPVVSEFAVDEVATALRLSRSAAGARLHVAVELATRLPATATALRDGTLDVPKARAVVEATAPLRAHTATAVQKQVLPVAGSQTVGQLRASLARAVLAADPADAETRHHRAAARRRVVLQPLPDGMAELCALLPADGAAAVWDTLDALARRPGGADARSMDARRADALVDLAVAAASGQHPGQSGRLRAQVHVTVSAATLLGVSGEPGELAGYGPIPVSMARRLAAGGTWRRILTDPASGAVLDVGRRSYSPPPGLADHVTVRDQTCRFPGCRQPARRCDLDHTRPYPQGSTSAANLAALCRHHHRLKQHARWQVHQPQPGVLTWTSPTGHRYQTHPPAIGSP